MVQAFKLFCIATSALLFLQLVDAVDKEKTPSKDDTESKDGVGNEDQASFLKIVAKMADSRLYRVGKELSSIAAAKLNTFSNDFQATLNEDSKNRPFNDKNSLVLNGATNNLILPAVAFAKTSYKTIEGPVKEIISDAKKTYNEELAKSDNVEDRIPIVGTYVKKPIALIKASTNIVRSRIGSLIGKASILGKKRKAETSAEKSETEDKLKNTNV